jgi:hypothetical protein
MKVQDFIARALETGHCRYKLTASARGVEIACGSLVDAKPDELEALAREDAAPLSREGLHDYALVVESEDGAKRARMAIRVHGGKTPEDEHKVDTERATSPAAVVGHLTRLVVEQNKVIAGMFSKMVDEAIAEKKENTRLRRAMVGRGETEIVKRQLEIDAEESRDERAQRGRLYTQLAELAGPLLLKVLPGGPGAALQKFRAGLRPDQCEAACAILGASRFARLMSAGSPSELATLFLEDVDKDTGARLFALLDPEQQAVIGAALQAEMKRREATEEARAHAANGAAS